ncbi:MAG: fibronectin type III domain-containing protein, partial [Actinomycetia bacterium]|nr:fibronectin type III domain-containing protein [Actinomycetes bacterium]
AATDNVGISHYEVRRDGVLVDTEPGGSPNEWFVDRDLASGTTYTYEVVAVDTAGNVGPPASVDASTIGAAPPPDPDDPAPDLLPAPDGLRSTLQTRERIVLNWQSVPGAVSYVIQVDDGATFVDIGTKTSVWFTHRYLSAGTSYNYRVVAVDAAGERGTPSAPLVVATFP